MTSSVVVKLAAAISCHYGTGIKYKLSKEARPPIVVSVGGLQPEEDVAAIVVARMAKEDLQLLVLRG